MTPPDLHGGMPRSTITCPSLPPVERERGRVLESDHRNKEAWQVTLGDRAEAQGDRERVDESTEARGGGSSIHPLTAEPYALNVPTRPVGGPTLFPSRAPHSSCGSGSR